MLIYAAISVFIYTFLPLFAFVVQQIAIIRFKNAMLIIPLVPTSPA